MDFYIANKVLSFNYYICAYFKESQFMENLGFIFGIMGMSMGLMGFSFNLVSMGKIDKFEKQLKELKELNILNKVFKSS